MTNPGASFPPLQGESVRAADGWGEALPRPLQSGDAGPPPPRGGGKPAAPRLIKAARSLRGRMTETEIILWSRLRLLRSVGLHFRRQAPRNGYILDFVCLKAGLIIEIDGDQHHFGKTLARDRLSDRRFAEAGLQTMRFSNHEIRKNVNSVKDQIVHVASYRQASGAET